MNIKSLKTPSYRTLLLIIGFTMMYQFIVLGQERNSGSDVIITDTLETAFMPALAYNTDLGLVGGGLISRYHYRNSTQPFYSYFNANILVSTKGLISSSAFFDKPNIFYSDQRLTSEVFISRFLKNQYYGIGNYQELNDPPEQNPDYYYYNSFSTGFEFTLRRPLITTSDNEQLDIFGIANFDYFTPWGNENNRFIIQDQPIGIEGSHTAGLGLGFIWEGRDNEFAPSSGVYSKVGIEAGQRFYGSSYNYFILKSEARTYTSFHFIRKITFANRLSFQHSAGTLPFWKLAELGGEKSMRGYPENRFRDHNVVFMNTELRSWLFEFPAYEVRLGGTLFFDIGRTFSSGTGIDNIFSDLKYTYGFGGNSSFFNENFIFRGDIGFSEEGYGIYFTAGYMF